MIYVVSTCFHVLCILVLSCLVCPSPLICIKIFAEVIIYICLIIRTPIYCEHIVCPIALPIDCSRLHSSSLTLCPSVALFSSLRCFPANTFCGFIVFSCLFFIVNLVENYYSEKK